MKQTAIGTLLHRRLSSSIVIGTLACVLPGTASAQQATGEPIKIPPKTVVKARIVKQLKDAVLPRK